MVEIYLCQDIPYMGVHLNSSILAYYNNLCIYSLIGTNYQLIKNNLKIILVKVKYILLIKVMKIYF